MSRDQSLGFTRLEAAVANAFGQHQQGSREAMPAKVRGLKHGVGKQR
jgi:hypothetical protein